MCPIYEFNCITCEKCVELLLKFEETSGIILCDECSTPLQLVECPGGDFRISGVGIADPKSMRT